MLTTGFFLFLLLIPCSFGRLTIERYERVLISNDNEISPTKPTHMTKPTDHAKVARSLVHKSQWAATGTISTNEQVKGFPMVNIISIADSGRNEPSTGHIYFYLTLLDFTAQDVKEDNKITLLISDDEDLSCTHNNNTDPMEPTCARVILSGKVIQLRENTEEYKKAKVAFLSRHPAADRWIHTHTFFLCTLDISNIFVLDWYGGPHNVPVQDYYNVPSE